MENGIILWVSSFTLVYSAHFLSLMDFVSISALDVSVLIWRFQTAFFHVLKGSYHPIFSMEAYEWKYCLFFDIHF